MNLSSLTEAQQTAITHKDGPILVFAGPGAGKTFVITNRVRYLVKQEHISPSGILVITFTNQAALQMQKRYEQDATDTEKTVTFGTFHSVFFRILSQAYGFRGEQILKDQTRREIYNSILEKLRFEVQDPLDFYQAVSTEIGRVKERLVYRDNSEKGLISVDQYQATSCPPDVFRRFYHLYEEALQKRNLIDFDDMGVLCYELFTNRRDILESWQNRFRYILVDEMQDTNRLQYDLVRLLAGKNANLMVVGDDDQSIYRFRGADPEIMLQFQKDYPQGKVVLLDVNFRSVPSIVEHAKQLISHNVQRFNKEIIAHRKEEEKKDHREAVEVQSFPSLLEQRRFLVDELLRLQRSGVAYEKMAILYRTNLQPQSLVLSLQNSQIPFSLKDSLPNLFEHWVTVDIITYILLARQYKAEGGLMDRGRFLQVMNRPKRYIRRDDLNSSQVSFEALADVYSEQRYVAERLEKMERDLKMLAGFGKRPELGPSAALHYIRHVIGYEEYLSEYAGMRGIAKEDLDMILDELEISAKPYETMEEWFDFMEQVKKSLDKKRRERGRTTQEGVSLMTYHSAKGLEFSYVFLIDLVEGLTPYRKARTDEEMEEERRMFYVAVTRARDRVYLLRPMERLGKAQTPSRFLAEILDQSSKLKKGTRIHHSLLGEGTITKITDCHVTVVFDRTKKAMTLNLQHCMENRLFKII